MKSSGILKNFIFNTIGGALTIVVALVATSLPVHTIGAARYGVLSIVFILLGYFRFLDVRLSRTSTNALSKLRPDNDRPNRPFNRALFSYGAWVSVTNLLSPLLESLYYSRAGSMFGVAANPDALFPHHGANVLTSYAQYAGLPALSGRLLKSSEPLTPQPWLVPHGFTQTCPRNPLAFQNLWHQSLYVTAPDQGMSHNQWPLLLASICGKMSWIKATPADDHQHPGNTYGWFEENLGRRFRLWLQECSSVYAQCRNAAERPAHRLDSAGLRPHRRYSY